MQELRQWKPCGQMGKMRCIDIVSHSGKLIAWFETDFQVRTRHVNAIRCCAADTPGCIPNVICTKSEPNRSFIEVELASDTNYSRRVAATYFFREAFSTWAKEQVTNPTPSQEQTLATVLPFSLR